MRVPAVAAIGVLAVAAFPGVGRALPAGMEYEKVSPGASEKGDAGISAQRSLVRSSPDGRRFTFQTPSAIVGSQGAGVANQVVSALGPAGWDTRGYTPPFDPDSAGAVQGTALGYQEFTDDLTRGVVLVGDPAPVPGAARGIRNLYVRDLASGSYQLVTPPPVNESINNWPFGGGLVYAPIVGAVTGDLSHIVYESSFIGLTPDAPFGLSPTEFVGVRSAYEWVNGQTRLVGILPDGTPAPDGAVIGRGVDGGAFPSTNQHHYGDSAISEDGSRIVFTTPGSASQQGASGDIYVRENGTSTRLVSASQRTIPDPDGRRRARFQVASSDGRFIFFTSCEKLTDASTAVDPEATGCDSAAGGNSPNAVNDLYRYDFVTGRLVDLSAGLPNVLSTIGVDASGQSIYFVTRRAGEFGGDFYLSQEGGAPRRVARGMVDLAAADTLAIDSKSSQAVSSKDGRFLAFATATPQGAEPTGDVPQLYLYDAQADAVRCLTCMPQGVAARYSARLRVSDGSVFVRRYKPRSFDDQGKYLVFETRNALVAEDVNDRIDVYRYDLNNGRIELVSTGLGMFDQNFGDMSGNGQSIFFVTRTQVIPDLDDDLLADVYVARVGARKHEPAVRRPACADDECQGPLAPPVVEEPPGSSVFAGPSNVEDKAEPQRLAVFHVAAITAKQRRAWARSGRLTLSVRVSDATRLTARVRARVGSRQRDVARASRRVAGGGPVTLRLVLSRAARTKLRRSGSLRLSVAVSASGGGPVQSTSVTLRSSRVTRSGGAR